MTSAVTSRVRGIFQVRRTVDTWICTPVIYGSGTTFLPLEMNSREAIDLFTMCHLPKASLAQDSFIIEVENDISLEQLADFGFKTTVRV